MAKLIQYVWTHPLNVRGGRIAALARVGRWQLASRLMPGPIALPYVDDTYLFATRGMAGATGNWYCGLHEMTEMGFALHLLRPGEHFVDVGANVGSYTVLAAGAAHARVTAVEPIPETFTHLQRNVALNGLADRVSCHAVGLSDKEGTLRFTSGLDTVNHVMAHGEDAPYTEIPVITLDSLSAQRRAPTLIKIDVEGQEMAVLRGGQQTLSDPCLLAVIMETNGSGARYGISDTELRAEMRRYGFLPHGYDPFRRELIDAARADGNTVFIRDRSAVEARVRAKTGYRLVNGTL